MGLNTMDCHASLSMNSPSYPARYRTRTLNRAFVTASVARQSMQSGDMDCFTAFAMTATFAMTGLFMASVAKQSMTSDCMDRHGLRPRDDANNTVIARNVVTWQSVCGIGPDTGGSQ
jgi:hypothetical protein